MRTMTRYFLALFALFLLTSVSAQAALNFGVVPAADFMVQSVPQAQRFAAYLEKRLGEPVAVRIFSTDGQLREALALDQVDLAAVKGKGLAGDLPSDIHAKSAEVFVIRSGLDSDLRARLKEALAAMEVDPEGRSLLYGMRLRRFSPADNKSFHPETAAAKPSSPARNTSSSVPPRKAQAATKESFETLTLGMVADEQTSLRGREAVKDFAGQLSRHLKTRITLRAFADEEKLYDWFKRYRMVDVALLSKEFLKRRIAGEFKFLAEPADLAGQGLPADTCLAANPGLDPRLLERLSGALEQIKGAPLVVQSGRPAKAVKSESAQAPTTTEVIRQTPSSRSAALPTTFASSAGAAPQYTFGAALSANALLRDEQEARSFGELLGKHLDARISTKTFKDSDSLHQWLSRYRMVDVGLMDESYLKKQPAGEFIPLVSSADLGGSAGFRLVGRQGLDKEDLSRIRDSLLEMKNDSQVVALLKGVAPQQPEVAPEPPPAVEVPPTPMPTIPEGAEEPPVAEEPAPESTSTAAVAPTPMPTTPEVAEQPSVAEELAPEQTPTVVTPLTPAVPDSAEEPPVAGEPLPEPAATVEVPPAATVEVPPTPTVEVPPTPTAPEVAEAPPVVEEPVPAVQEPAVPESSIAIAGSQPEPTPEAIPSALNPDEEPTATEAPTVAAPKPEPTPAPEVSPPSAPEPAPVVPEATPSASEVAVAPEVVMPEISVPEPAAPPEPSAEAPVVEATPPAEPEIPSAPVVMETMPANEVVATPPVVEPTAEPPVIEPEVPVVPIATPVVAIAPPVKQVEGPSVPSEPVVETPVTDTELEATTPARSEMQVASLAPETTTPEVTRRPEPPEVMLRPSTAREQIYVVPFISVMVPLEVENEIFDNFVETLSADALAKRYEFIILKGGLDSVEADWTSKHTYITGEIFGYVEDSGCCSTDIRTKSRVFLYHEGTTTPTLEYEYPVKTFFDHDYSTLEKERRKLADNIAAELAAKVREALSGT